MNKGGMKPATLNKLKLIANAIVDSDCNRDEGRSFKDLEVKDLETFKRKILREKSAINCAIALYCNRNDIQWKNDYTIDNVCKTVRQLNYLVNEVLHYIKMNSKKSLERHFHQMEFDFT